MDAGFLGSVDDMLEIVFVGFFAVGYPAENWVGEVDANLLLAAKVSHVDGSKPTRQDRRVQTSA